MIIVRTLVSACLLLVSIVVAAHFVFTPFYQDTMDIGRMWFVLNWFMAVAAVVALIVNYHRYRVTDGQSGDGSVNRQYLQVSVGLFASLTLVIWYFWNWFDDLTITSGSQSDIRLIMWSIIDPLFVLVTGATGLHLWRFGRPK